MLTCRSKIKINTRWFHRGPVEIGIYNNKIGGVYPMDKKFVRDRITQLRSKKVFQNIR